MGDVKINPVFATSNPKPPVQNPKAAARSKIIIEVIYMMYAMESAERIVAGNYESAKRLKDIIRMNCLHERRVRIRKIIEEAKKVAAAFNADQMDPPTLKQKFTQLKARVDKLEEGIFTCGGKKIVGPSETKVSPKAGRLCFRYPGMFGAPRLAFANKSSIGFGLKLSAAAEYVSSWDKDGEHANGIRGLFTLGISGLNLRGGRWGKWIMLLGLTGGVGIGTLKARGNTGVQQQTTEYTPRAGAELNVVAFARSHLSLILKGGYLASIMKRPGENNYSKQHGGYGSVGLEFVVPKIYDYITPEINIGYSGYQDNRNEFTTNIGIRF